MAQAIASVLAVFFLPLARLWQLLRNEVMPLLRLFVCFVLVAFTGALDVGEKKDSVAGASASFGSTASNRPSGGLAAKVSMGWQKKPSAGTSSSSMASIPRRAGVISSTVVCTYRYSVQVPVHVTCHLCVSRETRNDLD